MNPRFSSYRIPTSTEMPPIRSLWVETDDPRGPYGAKGLGAMARHADVEHSPEIARSWPLLAAAEAAVSTLQVRNRGTLCGSVAHAFPTADPPAALIASDARVRLASKARGERDVAAEDFFRGLMQTAAEPDELVTAVSLPPQPPGARWAHLKYS